jgi:hypothetical protein
MGTTAYRMIDSELIEVKTQVVKNFSSIERFLKTTKATIRELEIEVGYDLFEKFM